MDDGKARARSRVLVVEDDEDTGEMLVSLLRDNGYAVDWEQRGEDALRRCITGSRQGLAPNLILLDLGLPDMSGGDMALSLARTLRVVPPVMVLSAQPPQLVQRVVRAIGAKSSMRKPFDVGRLLASIAATVEVPGARAEAIDAVLGVAGVSAELLVAMRMLETNLPALGEIRGGITDTAAWRDAHRLVTLARDELGGQRMTELGFDVALAYSAHCAAVDAERAFARAGIADGAAPLDFALADTYCYTLLQLAIALCRRLSFAVSEGSA